jgi:polysaccharide export outer membrane protein
MKYLTIALMLILTAGALHAQSQPNAARAMSVGVGATSLTGSANLPVARLGKNDLIGITVYDSPELTRTVRVDSDGTIRLPMLEKHIQTAGLYPEELEKAITTALVNEQVLVIPIVTVSVVEYRSRPISVVGAVKTPMTFQDTGVVTLLDAITQAGGLADDAGQEILVSREQPSTDGKTSTIVQRIPVKGLFDTVDPSLNVTLQGGDVVRVPEAGRFYVVGNVKTPGAYVIKDSSQSSVLKALALSQGLNRYSTNTAYIYRVEGGTGGKSEIPIQLKKIMDRKSPDVPLMANDILYIPEAGGRRTTVATLGTMAMIAVAVGTALIYVYH